MVCFHGGANGAIICLLMRGLGLGLFNPTVTVPHVRLWDWENVMWCGSVADMPGARGRSTVLSFRCADEIRIEK